MLESIDGSFLLQKRYSQDSLSEIRGSPKRPRREVLRSSQRALRESSRSKYYRRDLLGGQALVPLLMFPTTNHR
jgi:hypothetical protein